MGKAKLSPEQVAEIRRQYTYGRKRKLILAEFSITYHALWQIVNGRVYKYDASSNSH